MRHGNLRIGIPRAFFFYAFPDLWTTFLTELGHSPVVSPATSAKTIARASAISEAEHCLPNKLFDAHLAELADPATEVDLVLVPRVLSTVKGHIECPKLGVVPDAARTEIARHTEVVTIDIDENERPLNQALPRLARALGASRTEGRHATQTALTAMQAALNRREARPPDTTPRLLFLGHPYTLHEDFIAKPILRHLDALGVAAEVLGSDARYLIPDPIRWATSNKMYRRIMGLTATDRILGVLQLTTFNCGCDAMMIEILRPLVKAKGLPYLILMIDEHTAKGGIETRLEAFVDSLRF